MWGNLMKNKTYAILTILAIVCLVLWQILENELYSKLSAVILFVLIFVRTFLMKNDKKE